MEDMNCVYCGNHISDYNYNTYCPFCLEFQPKYNTKLEALTAQLERIKLTKIVATFPIIKIEKSVRSKKKINVPMRNFSIGFFYGVTKRVSGHYLMTGERYYNFFYNSYFNFKDIEVIFYNKDENFLLIKLKKTYHYDNDKLEYNVIRFKKENISLNVSLFMFSHEKNEYTNCVSSEDYYDGEINDFSHNNIFDGFLDKISQLYKQTCIGDYLAYRLDGALIANFKEKRIAF